MIVRQEKFHKWCQVQVKYWNHQTKDILLITWWIIIREWCSCLCFIDKRYNTTPWYLLMWCKWSMRWWSIINVSCRQTAEQMVLLMHKWGIQICQCRQAAKHTEIFHDQVISSLSDKMCCILIDRLVKQMSFNVAVTSKDNKCRILKYSKTVVQNATLSKCVHSLSQLKTGKKSNYSMLTWVSNCMEMI